MKKIQTLILEGNDPLLLGYQHGESLREKIKEFAEIRLERMCTLSSFKKISEVLELSFKHLPILKQHAPSLFTEVLGISKSANISLEHLIVINNYTDMRDISLKNGLDEDGCSIIFAPSSEGNLLGQTWDMHSSAFPYVIMLKFDSFCVFSVVGCLGMAGLNSYGVAVAINNLSSIDAKIGLIWPALVRKILSNENAFLAKEEIFKAELGSGHNYAIADEKQFFSIETSGVKKKLVCQNTDKNYFHTNHCLDEEMKQTQIIRKDSNTLWRYEELLNKYEKKDFKTPQEVFLALKSVSKEPQFPLSPKISTCGTLVMDPKKKKILACKGVASEEALTWPESTIVI